MKNYTILASVPNEESPLIKHLENIAGDINIVDTVTGGKIDKLLNTGEYVIAPYGTREVDGNGYVKEFKLEGFTVLPMRVIYEPSSEQKMKEPETGSDIIRELFSMYDRYRNNPKEMVENRVPNLHTIKNAADIYDFLNREWCYLPDFDQITVTTWGTIVFDIDLKYEDNNSLLSLEIGEKNFGYFTDFSHGINYELDCKEITYDNLADYLFPFLNRRSGVREEYMKSLQEHMAKMRNYKKHPYGKKRDIENQEESDV